MKKEASSKEGRGSKSVLPNNGRDMTTYCDRGVASLPKVRLNRHLQATTRYESRRWKERDLENKRHLETEIRPKLRGRGQTEMDGATHVSQKSIAWGSPWAKTARLLSETSSDTDHGRSARFQKNQDINGSRQRGSWAEHLDIWDCLDASASLNIRGSMLFDAPLRLNMTVGFCHTWSHCRFPIVASRTR